MVEFLWQHPELMHCSKAVIACCASEVLLLPFISYMLRMF